MNRWLVIGASLILCGCNARPSPGDESAPTESGSAESESTGAEEGVEPELWMGVWTPVPSKLFFEPGMPYGLPAEFNIFTLEPGGVATLFTDACPAEAVMLDEEFTWTHSMDDPARLDLAPLEGSELVGDDLLFGELWAQLDEPCQALSLFGRRNEDDEVVPYGTMRRQALCRVNCLDNTTLVEPCDQATCAE